MRTGWRILAVVLASTAALTGPPGTPLNAQPSSGWAREGALEIEKTVFMEALKRVLGPGGDIVANASDWVIDPLVTASTTAGGATDKTDAYLLALGQAGLNVAWPFYGISLSAGKLAIGGTLYTIEQMIAGARDQQAMAVLTGQMGFLGSINNPVAQAPFLAMPYVVNNNIGFETLGARITSEADLTKLWFENYGAYLRDIFGPGQARATLDAYWPYLLQTWRMQRAEIAMRTLAPIVDRALKEGREARSRVPPPTQTASSGACSGALAGTWRITERVASGAHIQDWSVAADGRAVQLERGLERGKPTRVTGTVRVTGRSFSLALSVDPRAPAAPADYVVAELNEKCTLGQGTLRETFGLRPPRQAHVEVRRVGDPLPGQPPLAAGPTGTPITGPGAVPIAPPLGDMQLPPVGSRPAGGGGPAAAPPPFGEVARPQAPAGMACGHTLGAGMYQKWQQLGGERGLLGCPTMSESAALGSPQGSRGTWANFQHGLITWTVSGSRAQQAFEVHGAIRPLYLQMGGSGSWLGFPVSDEYEAPGGRRSDFEGGYIFWNRASNQVQAVRYDQAPASPAAGGARPISPSPSPATDARGTYAYPQANGAAVDHCATWAANCGQGGADQFCRSQGYAGAARFQLFSPGRTYVLGSQQVCEGPHCVGFSQVICSGAGQATAAVPPQPQPPASRVAPACDAGGLWQAATDGIGAAGWTLTPSGVGRYTAREQGLGNATGTATVTGARLRIDWTTGGYAGYYEWDLGAACTGGAGRLVFTQGAGTSHGSRISRAAAGAPPRSEGHVPAPAQGRSYANPQMAGAAVDHCATWAADCGQGGADQFCRTQGHARAASFQTFAAGRTYVIGSRQICQGPHCVGLLQVTCAGR